MKKTFAEILLWERLRNRKLAGVKFRRQYSIGAYVVDFFCAEHAFAIEVDGGIHTEQRVLDSRRQLAIESNRICVLRFTNEDVCQDIEAVVSKIRTVIKGSGGRTTI